jgi:predicted transcriptional regulator
MRSVRLDEELENRLEEAARASGEPVSEIIREAVRRRCDEMLGGRLDRRLADVIGVIGAGGSSRRTGKAFTGLLAARTKAKKPKRRGRR